MKKIVLIRHAKSSWEHDVSDLDRPLSVKGIEDAKLVSKEFKVYNYKPDAIFSSSANRAKTTCSVFMDNLQLPENLLIIKEQLYDFGGNKVLRFIDTLDNDLNKIMIFGHNHAFTQLINSLGDVYIDNLPTSGLAMIEFDINHWSELKVGKTKIILKPKDLK